MRITFLLVVILISKISFCQNDVKLYYENDTINQVSRFGIKNGFWQHYYFNSDFDRVVTSEGYYQKNKQIGNWKVYVSHNGIINRDTLFKNGVYRIIINKGQYLTEINFDSTRILHFSINDFGTLALHDKCVKKNNKYSCRRYSKFGILLNEILDLSLKEALQILFW